MRDMEWTHAVDIAAPPSVVWSVLADVGGWPKWTTSVTSVVPEGAVGLAVGNRMRIVQPKLRPAVWTVTDCRPPHGQLPGWFTWVAASPGVKTTARHVVTPTEGGCRVDLRITQSGLLHWLLGRLSGGRTSAYMATEAAGLKARSEAKE